MHNHTLIHAHSHTVKHNHTLLHTVTSVCIFSHTLTHHHPHSLILRYPGIIIVFFFVFSALKFIQFYLCYDKVFFPRLPLHIIVQSLVRPLDPVGGIRASFRPGLRRLTLVIVMVLILITISTRLIKIVSVIQKKCSVMQKMKAVRMI